MLKGIVPGRQVVRWAGRWSLFGGSNKGDMYQIPEESQEMEDYQKQIKDLEREAREDYIESRRNKSRLSASHRQILQGKAPYDGVMFQYNDQHRSRKFKGEMFGRYGTRTGINPGNLWPTKADVELAKEWESLYQPEPLNVSIENVQRAEEAVKLARMEREAEIEANLAKLDAMKAAFRKRVEAKNRLADGEKHRREKILAELKTEFGYDINPEDEMMKNRIQEREKVLLKEERELKKLMQKEKKRAQAEEAAKTAAKE